MPEYVTLMANPRRRKRGGRRARRNPDIMRTIQRPLPGVEELIAGLGGAALALQAPHMLKATRWMNVLWSAAFTIGGAYALGMAKMKRETVSAFTLAGMTITAAKAVHVMTNGRVGLEPGLTALRPEAPAPSEPVGGELPARVSGGVRRWDVGGLRESQFGGSPEAMEDTLLT
mgnify:FL=1